MRMNYRICTIFLYFLFSVMPFLNALEGSSRNCLILLDQRNKCETIGLLHTWYLTSRLQSALAEQSTPILINAGLWNSFIERRIHFKQSLEQKDSPLYKIHELYCKINERIEFLSHLFNAVNKDFVQNKYLIVQSINDDFYSDENTVLEGDHQLLLNYLTPFDPQEWNIYKNGKGFYLFVPKKYSSRHPFTGFNIDSLEEITYSEHSPSVYFDSIVDGSIIDSLSDFFLTYSDLPDANMTYAWTILLAGHGGSNYKETNHEGTVTWSGQPIIADLTVPEFTGFLDFFEFEVKTHLLHYSCCYGGGNHIPLIFKEKQNRPYHYAIMCDTLTDAASYCKWTTALPSAGKRFLTTADLTFAAERNCWQLSLTPVYYWDNFFNDVAAIDFSIGSIERLQEMMSSITYSIISNIPLLCLPGTNNFIPLYGADILKIDERLLRHIKEDNLILKGTKTILLEAGSFASTLTLDHTAGFRIISIKPGDALHYIKKLQATSHIDLPSAFWQAQYQYYNKNFILDECSFPHSGDPLIFKNLAPSDQEIVLKNVIISQQKSHYIRLFFTLNDRAVMVVAHKPGQAEHIETATVQEIVMLDAAAREKYEEYFLSLKKTFAD